MRKRLVPNVAQLAVKVLFFVFCIARITTGACWLAFCILSSISRSWFDVPLPRKRAWCCLCRFVCPVCLPAHCGCTSVCFVRYPVTPVGVPACRSDVLGPAKEQGEVRGGYLWWRCCSALHPVLCSAVLAEEGWSQVSGGPVCPRTLISSRGVGPGFCAEEISWNTGCFFFPLTTCPVGVVCSCVFSVVGHTCVRQLWATGVPYVGRGGVCRPQLPRDLATPRGAARAELWPPRGRWRLLLLRPQPVRGRAPPRCLHNLHHHTPCTPRCCW